MLNRSFSWLTAAVVFALTGAVLWYVYQFDRQTIAFAVLGVNLAGVYACRRAFAYLSGNARLVPDNAGKLSQRKQRRDVTPSSPTQTETLAQGLLYGAGMGFGLGVVLTGCYLADVYGM